MLETHHKVHTADSRGLSILPERSVDLVVTSPPYPMIEMWDEVFSELNPEIGKALRSLDGRKAYALMHQELNKVWNGLPRVLKPGAWVCVNIGDATRTVAKRFQLYSNQSKVVETFFNLGFDCLPMVLWRKQTNAPNKFMGSGMLPAGAYVTLEHEYILIFRYGDKRSFATQNEVKRRQQSSFFWEERNVWFSDVWDFKGARQELGQSDVRARSGAFPFELAYRLINMYSMQGDTVLDPFLGTGTTMLASAAACRNSVGFEIDPKLGKALGDGMGSIREVANRIISIRLNEHVAAMHDYEQKKGETKHKNARYGFPVVTSQETELLLPYLETIEVTGAGEFEVVYEEKPELRSVGTSPPSSKDEPSQEGQLALLL